MLRAIDPDDREAVKWLSLFVRLAEVLDRGHAGAVRHAELSRGPGRRSVVLTLHPQGDWRLEEWGLESRRATLQKALGAELRVVAAPALRSPR